MNLDKYNGVIFDLDNTLYGYNKANEYGVEALCDYAEQQLGVNRSSFLKAYMDGASYTKKILNDGGALHSRLLYLQHTLELLRKPLFPHALVMEELFWSTFIKDIHTFEGVNDLLDSLKNKGKKVAICSDLTLQIQLRKITKLNIHNYIDTIVTSEESGFEKPNKKIFELTIEKLALPKNELLVIGDDLIKDIIGATLVNVDALWFNPLNIEVPTNLAPYKIDQFNDYRELKV